MSTRAIFSRTIALLVWSLPLAHIKLSLLGLPFYLPEVFTLAMLGLMFSVKKRKKIMLRPISALDASLVLAILLFCAGALFSFLANPFTLHGLGILKTWFFFPLLLAWLIWQWQPDTEERMMIFKAWFSTALLVGVGALGYLVLGQRTFDDRLAAWFGSPNYLAIFMAPGALIVSFLLREAFLEKNVRKVFAYLLGLAVLLVALFFTKSYGVWLAVLGSLAILGFFLSSKKAKGRILWILLTLAGVFFVFEHNTAKWQSLVTFEERSSMASRIMIWQSAAKMIESNPVFGIGPGRFQEVYLEYQRYFPPYLEWAVPQPHNIFLAVWLQAGILGLVGFTLLVGRMFQILFQNKNQEATLLLGLGVLYLIYGIFDTPYFKTDLAFSFWLIVALTFVLRAKK